MSPPSPPKVQLKPRSFKCHKSIGHRFVEIDIGGLAFASILGGPVLLQPTLRAGSKEA